MPRPLSLKTICVCTLWMVCLLGLNADAFARENAQQLHQRKLDALSILVGAPVDELLPITKNLHCEALAAIYDRVQAEDWQGVVDITTQSIGIYPHWYALCHRAAAYLWLGEYELAAADLSVSQLLARLETMQDPQLLNEYANFWQHVGQHSATTARQLAAGEPAGIKLQDLREAIEQEDWLAASLFIGGYTHSSDIINLFTFYAMVAHTEPIRQAAQAEFETTPIRPRVVLLDGLLRAFEKMQTISNPSEETPSP